MFSLVVHLFGGSREEQLFLKTDSHDNLPPMSGVEWIIGKKLQRMTSLLFFYLLNSSENSISKVEVLYIENQSLIPIKQNSFALFSFRILADTLAHAHGKNIQEQ